ncbi:MAG: ROK family protein [Acidobacteriota bacterium]|nr:ROK family protein [Acidobacteriota bacterium]
MPEYSIGVDLGGTNLRAAAITQSGEVIAKIAGRAQLSHGRDAVVDDMVGSITKLREDCGTGELKGVGIGVPGFILIEKGIIVGSNNLPDFEDFPVRDVIEQKLKTSVILENDANAAALGEKWIGAGKDVNDLVLLTLGTGIGGGIISAGKVLHGYLGMAGELGHMTVVPNGNPCGCGNQGCLEKHASATAISGMAHLMHLGSNPTAQDIFNMAEAGDERAKMIFTAMGSALGIAIGTLVNIFNFPLFLLSGGPLPAWDHFAPTMLAEIERRSFTFRKSKTRIEKAILGSDAGLFGAAFLGGGW